jgi:putative SOS response-associated peptidase YedK
MCSCFSLAEERDFLLHDSASPPCLSPIIVPGTISLRAGAFHRHDRYDNRKLARAKWGLFSLGKQGREQYSINARAETVESRPTFAEAFTHRRCVIPASGFYEWAGPNYARQPYWIHRRDGDLLLFAGLYPNEEADGSAMHASFTILTCAANPALATVHHRMPLILSDRDADDWMNPCEKAKLSLKALLIAAPEALLVVQPVSPLVNSVKNKGPELLASHGINSNSRLTFRTSFLSKLFGNRPPSKFRSPGKHAHLAVRAAVVHLIQY